VEVGWYNTFFCSKKHDQVGGCEKVSVILALHAHFICPLDETLHSVPIVNYVQMPLGTAYTFLASLEDKGKGIRDKHRGILVSVNDTVD
jgi:hypothetical protein